MFVYIFSPKCSGTSPSSCHSASRTNLGHRSTALLKFAKDFLIFSKSSSKTIPTSTMEREFSNHIQSMLSGKYIYFLIRPNTFECFFFYFLGLLVDRFLNPSKTHQSKGLLFTKVPGSLNECLLELAVSKIGNPELAVRDRIASYQTLVKDFSKDGLNSNKIFEFLCEGQTNGKRNICLAISVSVLFLFRSLPTQMATSTIEICHLFS